MDKDDLRRMFGSDPFRPRDEFDVDVHPESFRGKALAYMDALDEARTEIEAGIAALPWYQRLPVRFYMRLRGIRLV